VATDADRRTAQGLSFGSVADVYERSRPGYPEEAARWLVGDEPCDVVDLGAGTGKLTRSLVALGHRVTAVEPIPEMLAQLEAAVPGAIALAGTAESIPVADESVDVVTVAQAFHWFDHAVALREIARVLRPGGRIALVWNARDDRHEWVAEFSDTIVSRSVFRKGGVATAAESIDASGLYGPVEHAEFANAQTLRREELQELVRSRSECVILPEDERRSVLERTDALFDMHAVDGVLTMPYVTECFRAARI
jgi:ubiquinone/menaquinone biosynthesis C-methylase UbiE